MVNGYRPSGLAVGFGNLYSYSQSTKKLHKCPQFFFVKKIPQLPKMLGSALCNRTVQILGNYLFFFLKNIQNEITNLNLSNRLFLLKHILDLNTKNIKLAKF